MQEIKTVSFGCRLNALENDKIARMLAGHIDSAIVVNTCGVTGEAVRQCRQTVRKLARENPGVPIFITGCGATLQPQDFARLGAVIPNADKMKLDAYVKDIKKTDIATLHIPHSTLSKAFVQIQNGCDWGCTYCATRLARGPAISFSYDDILADARDAVARGFYEIVLTGVDIASWCEMRNAKCETRIGDLCKKLLNDVPEIKRLRLSSMDPASLEIPKIIQIMKSDSRMMPHLHLSMQSGSDKILGAMKRRHNADMVRRITDPAISYSWDIICGFPGETDELFDETRALVHELRPIHIHAFPFSPRNGTVAADMPDQIPRNISRARVKIISAAADENRSEFMQSQVGKTMSVLVEEKNIARTPDDLPVVICGEKIPARTICDVEMKGIENNKFIGKVKL